MNWFRKHRKHGSRLALFALAIQFALSFGHFHAIASQAAPTVQTGLSAIAASFAVQVADAEAAQRQQPSDHDTDQPASACAICAVLSLANNALLATPPPLELPRAVEHLYLTSDAEIIHLGSLHTAFRSRAPPAS